MTNKPTPEQIQRACDLLNAASGIPNNYNPRHYSQIGVFTALADTIAKLDAMQAERDKARADLGEIYIQLDGVSGLHRFADDSRQAIEAAHDLAATYRVETDPLVEALRTIVPIIHCEGDETAAEAVARQLRSDPRWLEIGRAA
jgi:hypothetical protein